MTTNKSKNILLGWVATLLVVTIWLMFFVGRLSGQTRFNYIQGSGMSPTLNQNDIVVTSSDKKYERFDLVTYDLNTDQKNVYVEQRRVPTGTHIGRVVGLPSEVVEVTKDSVLINRDKLLSLNIKDGKGRTFAEKQIPIGKYFILLDANITGIGERIEAAGVDSRYFGFISSEQMRKIVKIYKKSDLPWNATSELLSGFVILLFLIVFPSYIKRISNKNLFLIILGAINYIFLALAALFVFVSQDYFYSFMRVLFAFHLYYMGALIRIFGNNAFSVLMKGFGTFGAGALSMLALYDFFPKKRKPSNE